MNFEWNSETIRWYSDANDYTGFYKNIAADIAPFLGGCRSLADLGCGPGLLDFELYPLVEPIDCIDLNALALSSIRDRAEQLGIGSIKTREADCFALTGQWDAILMSFFGTNQVDCFLPFCRKLFVVVSVSGDSEMFPAKRLHRKNTADNLARFLDGKHIPYRLTHRQYEFGQPYRSLEDATRCVRQYAPGISDDETQAYLDNRLVETGDKTFPYYAPRQKAIGIFQVAGMLV